MECMETLRNTTRIIRLRNVAVLLGLVLLTNNRLPKINFYKHVSNYTATLGQGWSSSAPASLTRLLGVFNGDTGKREKINNCC